MDETLQNKIFTNEDSTAIVNENNESLSYVFVTLSVIVKYCQSIMYYL